MVMSLVIYSHLGSMKKSVNNRLDACTCVAGYSNVGRETPTIGFTHDEKLFVETVTSFSLILVRLINCFLDDLEMS
jgi:hypothetical protein